MRQIDSVPETERRSVGKENIHIPATDDSIVDQAGHHLHHPPEHLSIGELVLAVVVAHRTAKTGDDELVALVVTYLSVNELSAERRYSAGVPMKLMIRGPVVRKVLMQMFLVVVSKDEVEGLVQHGDDELIILQRQIARRENEVHIPISGGDMFGINERIGFITDTKNFHAYPIVYPQSRVMTAPLRAVFSAMKNRAWATSSL